MICKKEDCTGCYGCYNICPTFCIEMKEDEFGFIYPNIEKSNCIECNLCKTVCPSLNSVEMKEPKKCYAAWALDKCERKSSTSGGVATIFSKYIIENNGVVFGAALTSNLKVEHIKVSKVEDLLKLKGSKYTHSYIGDSYKECKLELEKGINVIFIGTPCQIAGLNKFLRKKYTNLITIDIICHGVPSQKYLKEYIDENYDKNDYNKISFRDKDGYNFRIFKDNTQMFFEVENRSLYQIGFLKGLFCRENCYSCKYATSKRNSDITIGDFWGLGREKEFKHSKKDGVSVVLSSTDKGEEFIKKFNDKLFIEERSVSEAVKGNGQLNKPLVKHKDYEKFRSLYEKLGFKYAAKKILNKHIIIYNIKMYIRKNKHSYYMLKVIKNTLMNK